MLHPIKPGQIPEVQIIYVKGCGYNKINLQNSMLLQGTGGEHFTFSQIPAGFLCMKCCVVCQLGE